MNDGRDALTEPDFQRLNEFFDQTHWALLWSRIRAGLEGFEPGVLAARKRGPRLHVA